MSPRMRPRGQAKRHPLNMRTTEAMRRRLEQAAEASGRSLVQEVEHRLERTFTQDEAFEATLGGKHNADLFRALTTATWLIEKGTGKQWSEDIATAHQVRHALSTIVLAIFRGGLTPQDVRNLMNVATQPLPNPDGSISLSGSAEVPALHAALAALSLMGLAPLPSEIDFQGGTE
jgi:TraY domain